MFSGFRCNSKRAAQGYRTSTLIVLIMLIRMGSHTLVNYPLHEITGHHDFWVCSVVIPHGSGILCLTSFCAWLWAAVHFSAKCSHRMLTVLRFSWRTNNHTCPQIGWHHWWCSQVAEANGLSQDNRRRYVLKLHSFLCPLLFSSGL